MDQKQNAFLRVAISGVLLMGGSMLAQDAVASYCTISGCVVTPEPSPPDGGGSGGGGGSWSGNSTSEDQQECEGRYGCPPDNVDFCAFLIATKPPSCPNPIPMPSGHAWPKNIVPAGSGVAKAIYFADHQSGVYPGPRQTARSALAALVRRFADQVTSMDFAVQHFGLTFKQACDEQSQLLNGVRPPGVVTASERQCATALDRILAEANKQPNFTSWFIQWADTNGIDLSDLGIPQTVINWLSPANSLTITFEKASTDGRCALWWGDIQDYQCSVP